MGQVLRLQGTRDLFDFKEFQLVAHCNVVVVFEFDTALEPFFDFANVVFEAFE
jgi:hypothetical protein